jgi:phosphoribosylformylglycinamidine cyclo-ligase
MNLYKKSGVDIGMAEDMVAALKKRFPSIGGYAGVFPLAKHKLAATCDGVGTKIKLAVRFDMHEVAGQDLVAMSVNDLIAAGARPLFFLDYFSCGKLEKRIFFRVLKGIEEGINLAGCTLLGGEIAEMPGMYKKGDYDLAGFACGIIENNFDKHMVKKGDVLIGLKSSGIHSNGFSLLRKIFSDAELEQYRDLIMKPTKIYSQALSVKGAKNMAHVTGGGMKRALTRLLPKTRGAELFKYNLPKIFKIIQRKEVTRDEMSGVFNMGWGMIIAAREKDADEIGGTIIGVVR